MKSLWSLLKYLSSNERIEPEEETAFKLSGKLKTGLTLNSTSLPSKS